MTIELSDEVIVFADSRVKRQRRTEAGLYGSALYALRHFKEGSNWYGALLSRAATLMRNDYRKITGDKGTPQALKDAVDDFLAEAESFLNKTKKPTPETIANAARIIAQSLSTGATNAAAEAAGRVMDTIQLKTWVSMEDEKVRPTHAAAHGQTVPVGEKFDVGGHKMRKPGDLTAPPEEVINCRCIIALSASEAMTAATLDPTNTSETPGVEMAEDESREGDEQAVPLPDEGEEAPPERPENPIDSPDEPTPFWGVMAPENIESGDGRMFAESALRSRPLPLPLATQRVNEPGHDGSVKTGNIERVWRRSDGMIYYTGHFLTTVPEADEVIGLMVESGGRTGVSVDADDATMSMQTRDGRTIEEVMAEMEADPDMEPPDDIITVFDSARVCGATTCNIPAFHEAFIELGEVPEEFAPQEGEDLVVESLAEQMGRSEENPPEETVAAAAFVKTEDGPGWLTHPVDTDRLRDYWTRGAGAAKIAWGTPGDFNRCRTFLAEYIKPQYLSGYCANRHYDALGFWPGNHHSGESVAASAGEDTMAPALTLVASGSKVKAPPREWFDDPELDGPTAVTITEDGRVFGHVATWGTCHIGFPDSCTEPPRSMTDYAYFRTGATLCANGENVPTGSLTVGTGHANIKASAKAAMAHYDDTGACAATVAAGEDEHGIWIAGALNPFATEEQVFALRSAALSGDWRGIGGNLEMVAALAVNVPGFPIPRTAMAASAGEPVALVASGIVPTKEQPFTQADLDAAVEAALARREAKQKMEELRANTLAVESKHRMAALAAASK